ncbi:thioredoxin family protein [Streptomyces sp. SCL15-6]|jgi:thioredoxin 1|uniref:thioredoxin family protein n=1 Tax=Streptomyces sp. SCL15-6 TaxID=2967222 RepID=UPI0029665787|nr:thioredoxin family protein [Streptomyces sp. SCL15-6]
MELTPVTDADFDEVVLKSDKPVVVDFWATWCGPCQQLKPLLEAIAAEHSEIVVVKLDVDANPEDRRCVQRHLYPDGERLQGRRARQTITGARTKAALERELGECFA